MTAFSKMNVILATQIFSHNAAKGISLFCLFKTLPVEWDMETKLSHKRFLTNIIACKGTVLR